MNINRSIPKGPHLRLKQRLLREYRQMAGAKARYATIDGVPAMLVVLHEDVEAVISSAFDRRRKT